MGKKYWTFAGLFLPFANKPNIVKKIRSVTSIFFALVLSGCALKINNVSEDAGTVTTGTCSASATAVTLVSLYPGFDDWNDYVRKSDVTAACDGSESGAGHYWNCIHAGERKKVVLPGANSCTGLTAADSLGAFKWICDDSGSDVFFYSEKLNFGKGLRDLIDPVSGTAFKSNSVSVSRNGCTIYQTASSNSWWGNSLSTLPNLNTATAFQTLSGAGTIYTTTASASSNGFDLDADGISVVTLGDSTINYYGTDSNLFLGSNTILGVNNNKFIWIEAKISGVPTSGVQPDYGIRLEYTKFSRIYLSTIGDTQGAGIYLTQGAQNNLISQSTIFNASLNAGGLASHGISIWNGGTGASYNTLHWIRVANVLSGGAVGSFGDYLHVTQLTASNLAGAVITNQGSNGVFTGITGINSGGINDAYGNNTLAFVTSINHNVAHFSFNSNNTTLTNSLLAGGDTGLWLRNTSSGHAFYRLAIANHEYNGIDLDANTDDNRFHGEIWVGTSGMDCRNSGSGPLGNWFDDNCDYGSATPVTPAESTTLDMSTALIAQVTSDTENAHGASPTQLYTAITDWINFSSFYRGWGFRNLGQPTEFHYGHRNKCDSGETCQIWDTRFLSSGSLLKNIAGTFDSENCPASVDSTTAANVASDNPGRNYLVSAMEIVHDFIGNDNGLCESNEACIFAPHVGSYLGEGDYENNGSCVYAGGNGVTNYTIYGYPISEGSEN